MYKLFKLLIGSIGLITLLLLVTPNTSVVHAAVNCGDPNIICKSGAINGNETWTSNNIYVITGDLTISSGVTVNIDPGTIIKFVYKYPYYSLFVDGTLNVNGTSNNKVYFTSERDDTLGGDTDQSSSTPAAGQWKAIHFRSGSSGAWTYAELRYGGDNGGAIALNNSSPSFDHITVKNSELAAITALPTDMPTITNFSAQDTPRGGLNIQGGAVSGNVTWSQSDIVYIISNDVTVNDGATLNIEPGVMVKFTYKYPYYSLFVDGTLNVNGTSDNKVYFSSERDDTLGGDTNGNGSSNSPAAGQWNAVHFRNGSSGTWTYAELRYGGNNGGAIALNNSSPSFDHITVKNSELAAITALPTDMPTITNFSAQDTPRGGLNIQGGAVTGNVTWSQSDIVYIISNDVTINDGATLNIEPGVMVKFTYTYPYYSLFVDGTLNVNGTSNNKVYFSSERDDTLGGDTNGNGSSNSPAAGQWNAVHFRNGSSGTWTYAELRYGGNNGGAIALNNSSPSFDHITVKNSELAAITALPTDMPTITNFSAQDTPRGGLNIQGGAVTGNVTWSQSDIVYIISNDVTINDGATLNIEPGVMVKFTYKYPYYSLFVDGTLNVNGTSDNKVYFSSERDDTLGGDTNGNGSSNAPAAGNWHSIHFQPDGKGTINYAELRYGGTSSTLGAIHADNSNPTITNSTLRFNHIGLFSSGAGAAPTITNSQIYDNSKYGVYNDTAGNWIDATGNWWGDDGGPNDDSNSDGNVNDNPNGDDVSDYVNYSNWQAAPNLNNFIFLPAIIK